MSNCKIFLLLQQYPIVPLNKTIFGVYLGKCRAIKHHAQVIWKINDLKYPPSIYVKNSCQVTLNEWLILEVINPHEMVIYIVDPGQELFFANLWFPIRQPKEITLTKAFAYYDINLEREETKNEADETCNSDKNYNQSSEFHWLLLIHKQFNQPLDWS